MIFELILPLALLAGGQGGEADTADSASQSSDRPTAALKVEDPDGIRCRYIRMVNSRIPERICRTNARWAEIKREQEEALLNGRRSGGNAAESGTIYGADGN